MNTEKLTVGQVEKIQTNLRIVICKLQFRGKIHLFESVPFIVGSELSKEEMVNKLEETIPLIRFYIQHGEVLMLAVTSEFLIPDLSGGFLQNSILF